LLVDDQADDEHAEGCGFDFDAEPSQEDDHAEAGCSLDLDFGEPELTIDPTLFGFDDDYFVDTEADDGVFCELMGE